MTNPFAPGAAGPKSYRFALGSAEQPRSLIWRIWTRDDEVHLAVRTAAEEIGFTAYPTGRWRIVKGGAISRWHRPKDFRPGWTRGPDIVLPGAAVAVEPPADRKGASEPVVWLRAPAPDQTATIQMWFATPEADVARWRQGLPDGAESLMVLPLRRAGSLHLVRQDEPGGAEAAGGRSVTVSADQSGRPSFQEGTSP